MVFRCYRRCTCTNRDQRNLAYWCLCSLINWAIIGYHWFRKWLVASFVTSHHLIQWWHMINWTLENKIHWNLYHNAQKCIWIHDDGIKWKHFPRYWPFVRGIHRSPVNSPHKGQWRGTLMFSLICVWINDWVNNCEAGELRRYRPHYGVIVMKTVVIEFRFQYVYDFSFCIIARMVIRPVEGRGSLIAHDHRAWRHVNISWHNWHDLPFSLPSIRSGDYA